MKKRILALFIACIMVLGLIPAAMAETVIVTSPFTAAVAEVRSSVVGIHNYRTVSYNNYGYGNYFPFGFGYGFGDYGRGNQREQPPQEVLYGSGSGVVVADKYVLSNYHVVESAARLTVYTHDEMTNTTTELDASLAGYDEVLDLAILYVADLDLAPVRLGDSDTLQIGDWAICIGNPLSDTFYGTVTVGVISSLNRAVSESSYDKYGRKETTTVSLIQTDAAINPGNSGGGMFSVSGELMGIPERKYSGSTSSGADIDGIGMCIPINVAKDLIESVVGGKVTALPGASSSNNSNNTLVGKPRLGITITSTPFTAAVANGTLPNGVYVSQVDAAGPAAAAGMQPGDIIVELDGEILTSITQLQSTIASHKEGDVLNVKVYRVDGLAGMKDGDTIPDGTYIDLSVRLTIVDQVSQ